MAAKTPRLLRVLILQEGGFWVAQGIDCDIAAQGRDVDGARRAFLRTLSAQIKIDLENGRRPLEGIPPAPDWYFDAYAEADERHEFIRPPESEELYVTEAVSEQHVA